MSQGNPDRSVVHRRLRQPVNRVKTCSYQRSIALEQHRRHERSPQETHLKDAEIDQRLLPSKIIPKRPFPFRENKKMLDPIGTGPANNLYKDTSHPAIPYCTSLNIRHAIQESYSVYFFIFSLSISFHVFPFFFFLFFPFFFLFHFVSLFSFLGCSKSVAALQDSLGKVHILSWPYLMCIGSSSLFLVE